MIRWYLDSLFLSLLAGQCSGPVRDEVKLRAIRTEAATLMATHAVGRTESPRDVPETDWPPAIASLRPEFVSVSSKDVDITTKAFFDGGWGYVITRKNGEPLWPKECRRQLMQEIYWRRPC